MNYTENYQLPQWEKTDRIMMEDFNNMTEKIEAELTELSGEIAGMGYVIGKYTGNGSYPRTISLGFQPTAVIFSTCLGMINNSGSVYGGMLGRGNPLTNGNGTVYAEIVSNGFRLNKEYTNQNGTIYYYIAFK